MAKKNKRNKHTLDVHHPQDRSERRESPPPPAQPRASAAVQGPAQGAAVLRDQKWALHAYARVGEVPEDKQKDYKIAINDLGANILRGGLSAAMAAIERLGGRGELLLQHLAQAGVVGLNNATQNDLPARIRTLDVDGYMLATREMLQVTTWLKRAVQATFGGD